MQRPDMECPGGCGKLLEFNGKTQRWSHKGLNVASCVLHQYDPISDIAMTGYKQGKWKVVDGEVQRLPLSDSQLGNVVNVDFRNKKRLS